MKYTIELTNKQKAQMDCIIDIVHRYVGFNPKLEPIKATDVEDTDEYQIGYKVGYEVGKEDGQKYVKTCLEKEALAKEYNQGLEDAQEYIEKLYHYGMKELQNEFDDISIPDIIRNNSMTDIIALIKIYEEKKAEEEIKVGDEVVSTGTGNKAVVTQVDYDDDNVMVVFEDGSCSVFDTKTFRKTGRHFEEIEHLLSELKESEA